MKKKQSHPRARLRALGRVGEYAVAKPYMPPPFSKVALGAYISPKDPTEQRYDNIIIVQCQAFNISVCEILIAPPLTGCVI